VDIWALGCVCYFLATGGVTLFEGGCDIEQLGCIFKKIGGWTPQKWPQAVHLPDFHKILFDPVPDSCCEKYRRHNFNVTNSIDTNSNRNRNTNSDNYITRNKNNSETYGDNFDKSGKSDKELEFDKDKFDKSGDTDRFGKSGGSFSLFQDYSFVDCCVQLNPNWRLPVSVLRDLVQNKNSFPFPLDNFPLDHVQKKKIMKKSLFVNVNECNEEIPIPIPLSNDSDCKYRDPKNPKKEEINKEDQQEEKERDSDHNNIINNINYHNNVVNNTFSHCCHYSFSPAELDFLIERIGITNQNKNQNINDHHHQNKNYNTNRDNGLFSDCEEEDEEDLFNNNCNDDDEDQMFPAENEEDLFNCNTGNKNGDVLFFNDNEAAAAPPANKHNTSAKREFNDDNHLEVDGNTLNIDISHNNPLLSCSENPLNNDNPLNNQLNDISHNPLLSCSGSPKKN